MYESNAYERLIGVIRQVGRIATGADLDTLLTRALDLCINITGAVAGTLYLYDAQRDELVFRVVQGDESGTALRGRRFPADRGVAGATLRSDTPLYIADVTRDDRWESRLASGSALAIQSMYCLPLAIDAHPVGVVQVFNPARANVDDRETPLLLQIVGNTMAGLIEKARLIDEAQQREARQHALLEIQAMLTTTLDRNELLHLIMENARRLMNVEATSVWELITDDETGEQHLQSHVATGDHGALVTGIRVPFGQGIIGRVVETGAAMLVEDVEHDTRHYQAVDEKSGFQTRSILCVPLHAPRIQLGPERGTVEARTIGGAQALNKLDGHFGREDVDLFVAFANLAATVLQLSQLYTETYDLMMGMIKAMAGAVDARDRNNQQHSQRVSDFSVAIAHELRLPSAEIYHVRIGSLLHDIGKIGVPDAILDKPGRLDESELTEMRNHTVKGVAIMGQEELTRLLRRELPALLQHHERLDGRGYPHGLAGDQITQIARIVAVADVFDALTSERPYKEAWTADAAIHFLHERSGIEFDADVIAAIERARLQGQIVTQLERTHGVTGATL